jgi:hypothetical protein
MSLLNLEEKPESSLLEEENIKAIPSYIVPSVISLIFCCLPGIVAVCFSVFTMRDKKEMNYASALSNSSRAKTWMYVSYILGIISFISQFLVKFNEIKRR